MRKAPELWVGATAFGLAAWTAFSAPGSWNDDAYIFFQYAKNLATGNGLAFNAGESSFGITSVLWTLMLGLADRFLPGDAILAAMVLCLVLFSLSAALLTGFFIARSGNLLLGLWAGVLTAVYPTLLLEAVSGMEVALNLALLTGLVLVFFQGGPQRYWPSGLLVGLLFLCRPENVIWLPILVFLVLRSEKKGIGNPAGLILGFAALVVPWEIYLYSKTGLFLPPTGEGKLLLFLPRHYGITLPELNELGLLERFKVARGAVRWLMKMKTALVFAPFVVLVGCFVWKGKIVFTRLWGALAAYAAGLVILFSFFFPLVKMRYFAHLFPFLIFASVLACYQVWREARRRIKFLETAFWPWVGIAVSVLLIPVAAFVSAEEFSNLARVQAVRVQVAEWLKTRTEPGARIALEPIGAIAYFSGHPIVDLGGLVDPEVWPYMQKGMNSPPESLLVLLEKKRVNYIVDYSFHPWLGKIAEAFPERFALVGRLRFPNLSPPENEYDILKLLPAVSLKTPRSHPLRVLYRRPE